MNPTRFDDLLRSLTRQSSRRLLVRWSVALALSVARAGSPQQATARKRKKSLSRNAYGCVNVGGACRGKDNVCCSGICQGEKPKKGAKDTSRCVAHDEGSCQAGHAVSSCGGANVSCTTSTGQAGTCVTTTGNAGYCQADSGCAPCKTDADCRTLCGPQAACAVCSSSICLLVGITTLCVGPSKDGCDFPEPPIQL